MKRRGNLLNHWFNQYCFPILRDNRSFMLFAARIMGYNRETANYFYDFKRNALKMNESELSGFYNKIERSSEYTTDIVEECFNYIIDYASKLPANATVLDIGCGSGYLASKIAQFKLKVTGMDYCIPGGGGHQNNLNFVCADIKNIPCEDRQYDLVISAHTLEHIVDIHKAIAELRRVTKGTLIIVLPCQKEYQYMFDSHVHFFPYCESFERIMLNPIAQCWKLGGDIMYLENK